MSVPIKDSLLAAYSTNVNARLIASGETIYQLGAPLIAQYGVLHAAYLTAYTAMMDARQAGVRSEAQTATRNSAKLALRNLARQVYAFVQANLSIADSDKILLGVRVRGARSPIAPPTEAPQMEVIAVTGRTVAVRIHDGHRRSGKANRAVAAHLYSFVGMTYPADPVAWTFEGAATTARFDLHFASDLPGGTNVWIRSAWINPRQQAGPLSAPVTTCLQGGGAIAGGGMMKVA